MADFFNRIRKAVDDAAEANARRMGPPVDPDTAYRLQTEQERDDYNRSQSGGEFFRKLASKRISDESRVDNEMMMDKPYDEGHEGHGVGKVPKLRIDIESTDAGSIPPGVIEGILGLMSDRYQQGEDPTTGAKRPSYKMKGKQKYGW